MSTIVTIRVVCDSCGNFRVMETDSKVTARKALAKLGWNVVLLSAKSKNGGRSYGDRCGDCPLLDARTTWRYANTKEK